MTEQPFDDDLRPEEIAAMRWQAIEAANSHDALSAAARRVLIALIYTMDNKSRESYTSELWLSKNIGIHLQTVKKAKAELLKVGLVHWTNPNGPRHRSQYRYNWDRLTEKRGEARKRAREAVDQRREVVHSQGSPQTTFKASQSSPQATLEPGDKSAKVAAELSHGSHTVSQGSQQATAKVAATLPEQPCLSALSNQPSMITPSCNGVTLRDDSVTVTGQDFSHHPDFMDLRSVFRNDDEALAAMATLPRSQLEKAKIRWNTGAGKNIVRATIVGAAKQPQAPSLVATAERGREDG